MICQACQHDFEQIVYCDCFSVLCHQCFAAHKCGRENLARFTGAGDLPPEQPIHSPHELSDAMYELRHYQRDCLNAILEQLQ